jgi:hypothetical protein
MMSKSNWRLTAKGDHRERREHLVKEAPVACLIVAAGTQR